VKATAQAFPARGWVLLLAIVAVLAVAGTRLWWPTSHGPSVQVLGEKTTITPTGNTTSAGKGNANSNGSGNPGHPINVSGTVTGVLTPGATATLHVTVQNPNNQDLTLTQVAATLGTPSKAGCPSSWFRASGFSGTQTIKKNSTTTVNLLLSMLNKPVNQDACKSATVPVSFTATATNQ
jgi:hypothetical protein